MQATEGKIPKSITSKEWEFLELLAKGLTNKAIAAKLFLVEKTIQDRSIRVYAKLGLSHQPDTSPRVLATLWYWGITNQSLPAVFFREKNGST